ncbi:MAG: type 2 isopentenyl-diphosphate Delta-isomerase [Myxococcales bacterium]|jgi:isopentenyl-diphosphate delta-isomerase|nr:type 2 isopentenyl-diphosphate Delta-isomerase [Myxococcales bacterium]
MSSQTIQRKDHHLDLCAREPIEADAPGALFDHVTLLHEAVPDLSESQLDLRRDFLGRRLGCPLMFTAITGGTERGRLFNLALARQAELRGVAIGVGSQRAMLDHAELAASFELRAVAPSVPIVGNLGLWQARTLGVDGVRRLIDRIEADALAIHLNVAQELVQPEGDRDFSEGLRTIEALARALGARLVVKETGCGISPATAKRLIEAGVRTLDIAGMGGTSWIKVEALRAEPGTPAFDRTQSLGALFANWGIPTAPAIAALAETLDAPSRTTTLIASGGIRDGLAMAKALALGADVVGIALPLLKTWQAGGERALDGCVETLLMGLRASMVLTGAPSLDALRRVPRVCSETFERWVRGLTRTA